MGVGATHAGFQTTRWSLLGELRAEDPERRRAAAQRLSQTYWPAVYGFLRHRGLDRDAAEEATQAFFTDVVVGRQLLEGARPGNGLLRTLILKALRRYGIDQHRRGMARGAGRIVALDEAMVSGEEAAIGAARGNGDTDPEAAFDKRWAAAQVDETLRRCREYFERGRAGHWALFEDRVLGPSLRMTTPTPLAELAVRLGFRTATDASAAVQVVKKRFEAILREVIGETAEDVEEEYRVLVGLLG